MRLLLSCCRGQADSCYIWSARGILISGASTVSSGKVRVRLFPKFPNWVFGALGVALTLLPGASMAQVGPFSPIMCSQCPVLTPVDWRFGNSEIPRDPNSVSPASYNNHLHIRHQVQGNEYVRNFQFYISSFSTESGYDYLQYSPTGPGSSAYLTGALPAQWRTIYHGTSIPFNETFLFHSDAIVSGNGFNIGSALVCCDSSPTPANHDVGLAVNNHGFLLGAGDTTYYQYSRASTENGNENSVVLYNSSPGSDFDIYVRCNARPTQTTFDFGTPFAGSDEFLVLPANYCPGPSSIFIAVNSWSGAGQYSLSFHSRKLSRVYDVWVGYENGSVGITSADWTNFALSLNQGARLLYGATQGTERIANIFVHQPPGFSQGQCLNHTCDIMLIGSPGRDYVAFWGTQYRYVQWPNGGPGAFANARTSMHEWGHQVLGLPDEYADINGGSAFVSRCGHSMMADPFAINTLCTAQDHGTDNSSATTPYGGDSMWNRLFSSGRTSYMPSTYTPEPFSFQSHPLGNQVGVVSFRN